MVDATANGGAPDLTDPATAAGVITRIDAQLQTVVAEQARQGRMLDRISRSLGIEPEKSDPPPFRKELESLKETDQKLEKADAETSQRIEAVTRDIAETKLVVRVGLIEGVPKLVKVVGALVAVLGVLAALAQQVWLAVRGR